MLLAPAAVTPGVARTRARSADISAPMCSAFAAPFGAVSCAAS